MTNSSRPPARGIRAATLVAILLVLAQSAVGVIVNLYVAVPDHHPGAHPSSYLSGSFRSVVWAVAHGAPSLAIHAVLGLALILVALRVVLRSWRLRRPAITALATLAALLVIGAGFNGASFLDFDENASSLIMALLALASVGCYAAVLAVAS